MPSKRTYIYFYTGTGFYSPEPYDAIQQRVKVAYDMGSGQSPPPFVQADIVIDHEGEEVVVRSTFNPALIVSISEQPNAE